MCEADCLVRSTSTLLFAAARWGGGTKARTAEQHHRAGRDGQQCCWWATGQPGDGSGEEDKGKNQHNSGKYLARS